jgi:hypothetical protein
MTSLTPAAANRRAECALATLTALAVFEIIAPRYSRNREHKGGPMMARTARGVFATLATGWLGLLLCLTTAGCPNSAGITCPDGQMQCNGTCIGVTADGNNCGMCGRTCPAALACIAGECGCPGALKNCGDVCVDTAVDGRNCGDCGRPCGPSQVCSGGSCMVSCGSGLSNCNGQCINTMTDSNHCGMCGMPCGQFTICCGGSCVAPGTFEHCGSCTPCPNPGDFCSAPDGPTGTFQCLPG